MVQTALTRIFVITSLLFSPLFSETSDASINRVMEEIFSQHIQQKQMTAPVMRRAIQEYISQFDPKKTYLLQREVDSLSSLSNEQMLDLLQKYRRKDFSYFHLMDDTFHQAIERSREIRHSELPSSRFKVDYDLFPKNITELTKRIAGRKQHLQEQLEDPIQVEKVFLDHEQLFSIVKKEDGAVNAFVIRLLKAFAKALDSHTTFYSSDEAFEVRVRLEQGFYGVGLILGDSPEGVEVVRVVSSGPAERSGKIKEGDYLVQVDGTDVRKERASTLSNVLRDKNRQYTTLQFDREGYKYQVILKREMITIDEGRVQYASVPYEDGILGLVTLETFYEGANGVTAEKDLRLALDHLMEEGELKGLILDLRNNSGGFLNQAVKVAGLFITNGVVVISKYSNGREKFYRDLDGKVSFGGPLIILTSKATASAAEIVAQALQDYGVALVVGDVQTYGKGTIQMQTVTDGKEGDYYKVTVGKYYTASGNTPQTQGVKADIVVPSYFSDHIFGEETLEYPLSADTIHPAFKDPLKDVEERHRPWFMRYYLPTLQEKQLAWQPHLTSLRKHSEKRIQRDRDYHRYLQTGDAPDAQLKEAFEILKEMIDLNQPAH